MNFEKSPIFLQPFEFLGSGATNLLTHPTPSVLGRRDERLTCNQKIRPGGLALSGYVTRAIRDVGHSHAGVHIQHAILPTGFLELISAVDP